MTTAPGYRGPFNTPLETGLRSLFVLEATAPHESDLQRLVFYDYLLVHSGDVPGAPDSLHPATPHRSGELLVRRDLVFKGIALMCSRELVKHSMTTRGILYGPSPLTTPFLSYFNSSYATRLRQVAAWIASSFGSTADDELKAFIFNHLDRWGGEFVRESVVRGVQAEV